MLADSSWFSEIPATFLLLQKISLRKCSVNRSSFLDLNRHITLRIFKGDYCFTPGPHRHLDINIHPFKYLSHWYLDMPEVNGVKEKNFTDMNRTDFYSYLRNRKQPHSAPKQETKLVSILPKRKWWTKQIPRVSVVFLELRHTPYTWSTSSLILFHRHSQFIGNFHRIFHSRIWV